MTEQEKCDAAWRARQVKSHLGSDRECPPDWGAAFKSSFEAGWQAKASEVAMQALADEGQARDASVYSVAAPVTPSGAASEALAHTELREALLEYMAAFGQAIEAHGIQFGQQQEDADKRARAAIKDAT